MPYKEVDLGDSNRFTKKIDVLDLLINILREHEEKLDELVTRVENVMPLVELLEKKIADTKCITIDSPNIEERVQSSNSYKL